MEDVGSSDGVLWIAPVYVCLIPSQYKRFIELIHERKFESVFQGKYTAVMTTSVHFYDHTAHNYMHAVCDDLEMKYVDYFSPDMSDPATRDKVLEHTLNARTLLFPGVAPALHPAPAAGLLAAGPDADTTEAEVVSQEPSGPSDETSLMIADIRAILEDWPGNEKKKENTKARLEETIEKRDLETLEKILNSCRDLQLAAEGGQNEH